MRNMRIHAFEFLNVSLVYRVNNYFLNLDHG